MHNIYNFLFFFNQGQRESMCEFLHEKTFIQSMYYKYQILTFYQNLYSVCRMVFTSRESLQYTYAMWEKCTDLTKPAKFLRTETTWNDINNLSLNYIMYTFIWERRADWPGGTSVTVRQGAWGRNSAWNTLIQIHSYKYVLVFLYLIGEYFIIRHWDETG